MTPERIQEWRLSWSRQLEHESAPTLKTMLAEKIALCDLAIRGLQNSAAQVPDSASVGAASIGERCSTSADPVDAGSTPAPADPLVARLRERYKTEPLANEAADMIERLVRERDEQDLERRGWKDAYDVAIHRRRQGGVMTDRPTNLGQLLRRALDKRATDNAAPTPAPAEPLVARIREGAQVHADLLNATADLIERLVRELDEAKEAAESLAQGEQYQYERASAALARIAELEPDAARWIPVSERLPEVAPNLVFNGERVYSDVTHPSWWNHKGESSNEFDGPKVTHWMPLPKAPDAARGEG